MASYLTEAFGVFAILLVLLSFSRLKFRRRSTGGHPLPPGPKRLPLVGNAFDMPQSDEWLGVAEWAKTYGDIIYVENFGCPLVFLNSYEAAYDLLEKRSSIYSDRPIFIMLREIMGWDWNAGFMPYGDRLRKHRWVLHRYLNHTAVKDYMDLQTREMHRLLSKLVESPGHFDHHIRNTAAAIIMLIAYGYEVVEDDPYIELAEKAMSTITQAGRMAAFFVDFIPWLKYIPEWFPGAEFKKKGNEWSKLAQDMLTTPYALTKKKIREGTAQPSMTSSLLEARANGDAQAQDEDVIAASTAVTYAAGAETSVASLLSFLLAAVLNPEIQRRGQEELDRVVGKNRLPTFADRPSLPYIEGIVRETMRWHPVVPMGGPHRLSSDDVYKGYFIPAGTTVMVNVWSLFHDEVEYPDPYSFRPERWMPKEGQPEPMHPDKLAFGFGRRMCPGRHLADNSIFIGIASILAMFNIEKALDADGNLITPPEIYNSGLVSLPQPFDCRITPRSPEAVTAIRHALEELPKE